MGEVITNELLAKQMQAGFAAIQAEQKAIRADMQTLQAGQEAIRDELANLNDTTRALAKSNVSIRREISELKDRMTILSVAVDEGPHTHA